MRPLHRGVRISLFASILAKPLVSLVVSPRHGSAVAVWGRGVFRSPDLAVLATVRIERLELDYEVYDTISTPILSSTQTLHLTQFRVFASAPDALIFQVVRDAGESLNVVDIYIETIPGFQNVVESFLSAPK